MAAQLAGRCFTTAKLVLPPSCCSDHASEKDPAAGRRSIPTAVVNSFCKIGYYQEQSVLIFLRTTFLKVVKEISMQFEKDL